MILLTKDKILRTENGEKYGEVEMLTCFLDEGLQLEEGVTFERFFLLLLQEKDFVNAVFMSAMGGYEVGDYQEELTQELPSNKDIDYLVLSWRAVYFPPAVEEDERGMFDFDLDLSGVRPGHDGEGEKVTIGFSSLYEYKSLPMHIDPLVSICNANDGSVFNCGEKIPTVYEVISAILDEITFYGKPEERNQTRGQVLADTEACKKELSDEATNNDTAAKAN